MINTKLIIRAAALTLAVNTPAFASGGHGGHEVHWGYGGEAGPGEWGNLKADYAACGAGTQQSPINIKTAEAIEAEVGSIKFAYQDSPLRIVNNGHTIQINYAPGSYITVDGQRFELLQFHFHTPSEHTINDHPAAMELHFVHKNAAGELAVVGVMMDTGRGNPGLQTLWENIPHAVNQEQTVERVTINAAALLPKETEEFFNYKGSLTTPPCTEIVNWFVLKQPIQVSSEQVAQFSKVVGKNARPVQNVNRRFVLVND